MEVQVSNKGERYLERLMGQISDKGIIEDNLEFYDFTVLTSIKTEGSLDTDEFVGSISGAVYDEHPDKVRQSTRRLFEAGHLEVVE